MELVHPRGLAGWGRVLGKFVTLQFAIQAISLAAGMLIVRALTQREYAFYTLANTYQGVLTVLSDTGIGIGLNAIGGRVWSDPARFGRLVATGISLRRSFFTLAFAASMPLLFGLLQRDGASWREAAMLTVVIAAAGYATLSNSVHTIALLLVSRYERLQWMLSASAAARLAALSLLFVYPRALTAVAIASTIFIAQSRWLKRWSAASADPTALPLAEDRREILAITRIQFPNVLFYCLHGQITLTLVSLLGHTQMVAELGALGRLTVIFSVVTAVLANVVAPAFARCHDPNELRRRFLWIMVAYLGVGGVSLVASWYFADPLLWLLGPKYAYLGHELPIAVAIQALDALTLAVTSLNQARAWVHYLWVQIPAAIGCQALLLSFMRLDNTRNALIFGLLSLTPVVLVALANTWIGLHRMTRAQTAAILSVPPEADVAPEAPLTTP